MTAEPAVRSRAEANGGLKRNMTTVSDCLAEATLSDQLFARVLLGC